MSPCYLRTAHLLPSSTIFITATPSTAKTAFKCISVVGVSSAESFLFYILLADRKEAQETAHLKCGCRAIQESTMQHMTWDGVGSLIPSPPRRPPRLGQWRRRRRRRKKNPRLFVFPRRISDDNWTTEIIFQRPRFSVCSPPTTHLQRKSDSIFATTRCQERKLVLVAGQQKELGGDAPPRAVQAGAHHGHD